MQCEESKTQLTAASKVGERYWMATLLLIVIIVACIGIIYHQHMEMKNCLSRDTESRGKIETLVEQKGANEQKNNQALTLMEQADKFLNRTMASEDRLIKDAKECQTLVQQLVQNVTALTVEKEAMANKYQSCNEKLTTCEGKK